MRELRPFIVEDVSEADILEMMEVMRDNNPVHSDHGLVEELGLRGLVNQGPANLGYALNMLIDWAGDPAAVRTIDVRFHAITCPGDRLIATGAVVSTHTEGDATVATCTFRLVRETGSEDELILTGTADVVAPKETRAR